MVEGWRQRIHTVIFGNDEGLKKISVLFLLHTRDTEVCVDIIIVIEGLYVFIQYDTMKS